MNLTTDHILLALNFLAMLSSLILTGLLAAAYLKYQRFILIPFMISQLGMTSVFSLITLAALDRLVALNIGFEGLREGGVPGVILALSSFVTLALVLKSGELK